MSAETFTTTPETSPVRPEQLGHLTLVATATTEEARLARMAALQAERDQYEGGTVQNGYEDPDGNVRGYN